MTEKEKGKEMKRYEETSRRAKSKNKTERKEIEEEEQPLIT